MLSQVTRVEVIASGLISLADLTGRERLIPTCEVGNCAASGLVKRESRNLGLVDRNYVGIGIERCNGADCPLVQAMLEPKGVKRCNRPIVERYSCGPGGLAIAFDAGLPP